MKRFTAVLLAALMLCSAMAMFASAASENTPVTFYAVNTKPVLDGVVKPGEYGDKIHSVDYDNSDEFIDDYDPDHLVKADFYGTWTNEGVYLAWVCYSDIHVATAYDNEMWKYCVIQFCTTPGNPMDLEDGEANELGICVSSENGQPHKWVYQGPTDVEDWQFNGKRDENAKTTTYEVFLPWSAVTAGVAGNVGTEIGVGYALGDQEDFTVEERMVEWQDTILGGKNYGASAVVTLAAAKTAAPATSAPATSTTTAPATADPFTVVAAVMAISAGAALSLKKRR
ncbi:MAG: hypothetical protein IJO52_09950 [Clostridia bacterium]|nr:hypothetical protein [Clostridia bacterium]